MDLLPPTAPSLVFAHETCTPYYNQKYFRSWSGAIYLVLWWLMCSERTSWQELRALVKVLRRQGRQKELELIVQLPLQANNNTINVICIVFPLYKVPALGKWQYGN